MNRMHIFSPQEKKFVEEYREYNRFMFNSNDLVEFEKIWQIPICQVNMSKKPYSWPVTLDNYIIEPLFFTGKLERYKTVNDASRYLRVINHID